MASGLAFLETGASPLAQSGGPAGSARGLNFCQAFNRIGSIVGVLVAGNGGDVPFELKHQHLT
jgi:fucose permease